jgi:hypothetical protein
MLIGFSLVCSYITLLLLTHGLVVTRAETVIEEKAQGTVFQLATQCIR